MHYGGPRRRRRRSDVFAGFIRSCAVIVCTYYVHTHTNYFRNKACFCVQYQKFNRNSRYICIEWRKYRVTEKRKWGDLGHQRKSMYIYNLQGRNLKRVSSSHGVMTRRFYLKNNTLSLRKLINRKMILGIQRPQSRFKILTRYCGTAIGISKFRVITEIILTNTFKIHYDNHYYRIYVFIEFDDSCILSKLN